GDFTEIQGSQYSAAQVSINMGTHNLSSAFPFGVSVYGFADDESYGYLGGQAFGQVAEVEEITLTIEPVIGQGSEYCFTASALDSDGIPLAGVRIDFLVEGDNNAEGFAVTDSEGAAEFCYTPENVGEDIITASLGNISAQATVVVEVAAPASLTLEPEIITVNAGTEVCITGVVLDQFDNLLEGIEIFTEIDGELVGSGISDENGEVQYCFTPTTSGTIEIVCYYEVGDRITAEVTVLSTGENLDTFTLIDSETDTDLLNIQDGGTYAIEDLPELLAIRADLNIENVGSVIFELEGPFSFRKTESNAPYALFGNMGNDYTGRIFPPGDYRLKATTYTEAQGQGTAGAAYVVNFSITLGDVPEDLSVLGFDLYDAVLDTKIMDLVDGSIIDLGTLDRNSLSVLAITMPDFIGSLKIQMEGPINIMRIENNRPYTLFANNSNNFFGREFPKGNYKLMATPFTLANAQGTAGIPLEINFEVVGTPVSERMNVYPVPFKDNVFVDFEGKNESLDIRLFDYLGQPVKADVVVESGRIRVATNTLKEGLYVMQIFSQDYPIKTLKVQKMR
ncbi:MAG: T9SS type A sorting domain-containing protein, partial [Leeuwenhoekiella sp.]